MVSASTDRRLLHPSTLSPLIRNIMRGTSLVALVDVIRQIRRRQAEHIPLDLQVEGHDSIGVFECATPSMEPQAAAKETRKQRKLKLCNIIHSDEDLAICLREMYISMGKYTVRGQNPTAPSNASTSLKKGISIARTVLITTKVVLQSSRKMLMLQPRCGFSSQILDLQSCSNLLEDWKCRR
ncbi:hypothetical protein MUK42_32645 [Musa troglodytarum]|uniref:Uncharacterized protein n=1 Tax=Musa troglodytarum TaxID=320322 RepID=A0A9E7LF00_9LILI|nr:hypothetical protein MUK42_32645 [Musa troglodytarum]